MMYLPLLFLFEALVASFPTPDNQPPASGPEADAYTIPVLPSNCNVNDSDASCRNNLPLEKRYSGHYWSAKPNVRFNDSATCSTYREGILSKAVLDARSLSSATMSASQEANEYYFGADYDQFKPRIDGNFNRLFNFLSGWDIRTAVLLTCHDPDNLCLQAIPGSQGKPVGGYARNVLYHLHNQPFPQYWTLTTR